MLEIRDIRKSFRGPRGTVQALDGIALAVKPGEVVAVQGPSGCGKTTLLLIAGGLLAPEAGQVLLDGRDPYALTPDERARVRAATVGFVFQQFHLVPYLSVLDNILAAATARPAAGARARAEELAVHFGLQERLRHRPAALSTGERQRVALARALMNAPKLLLADEPTGNLDEANAEMVLGHLQAFARQGGGLLLVTHDPRAAHYAQQVRQLAAGKEVAACPT